MSAPTPEAEPELLSCANCGVSEDLWAWYPQYERQTIKVWLGEDGKAMMDYTGITKSGDAGPDESFYCGECFAEADTLEVLVGLPELPPAPGFLTDKQVVDKLNELLSAATWPGASGLEDVCAIVRRTGRKEVPDAPEWHSH